MVVSGIVYVPFFPKARWCPVRFGRQHVDHWPTTGARNTQRGTYAGVWDVCWWAKLVLVVMSWYGNCMMTRYVIGGVHQCRWWTVECDLSIFGLRSLQKQQVSAQMIGMELKSPCILYLDLVWSLYLIFSSPPKKLPKGIHFTYLDN